MQYNAQLPVAVFIGPSLSLKIAQKILPANYYPPVKMGDIYRILATGVQSIIIIDGVFHGTTPVWQREILSALQNGIKVIGTSSMGALRAAELEPYGMIGSGLVYEWYKEKRIEGDDEVSLLHGYAEQGYCALSEPLVNMRYTLATAQDRGVISNTERESLLTAMKLRYFGDRTYKALRESNAFLGLPSDRQQSLARYLETDAADLKKRDAEDTLRAFADHAFASQSNMPPRLTARDNPTRPDELLARGCLDANGQTTTVREALSAATKDATVTDRHLLRAIRQFYLSQWMACNAVNAPTHAVETYFGDRRDAPHHQLAASALTRADYQAEQQSRAATEWLLSQDHKSFGLDGETQRVFVETCSHKKLPRPFTRIHDDLDKDTAALPYILDWAHQNGIICPDVEVERYLTHCYALSEDYQALEHDKALREQALIVWLTEQGPAYFGYTNWSGELAVVRELQWNNSLVAPAVAPAVATDEPSMTSITSITGAA